MTATTQPGITLDAQIEFIDKLMEYRLSDSRPRYEAILASLLRLREIEGKLREPVA